MNNLDYFDLDVDVILAAATLIGIKYPEHFKRVKVQLQEKRIKYFFNKDLIKP